MHIKGTLWTVDNDALLSKKVDVYVKYASETKKMSVKDIIIDFFATLN